MSLADVLRWHRRARPELHSFDPVNPAEAEAFLRAFYAEHPDAGDCEARVRAVREQVAGTGTYDHTADELAWAARAAWRHAARCSGRDKWRALRIRDRRWACRPADVFTEVMAHLRQATGGGRIRSYITVFAPDTPARRGPRILNGQVCRYAGYRRPNGGLLGDPLNVRLTDLAVSLGWEGRGTAFDILPLVIRDAGGRLHLFPVPESDVLEVPVTHPDFGWFAELELKWHAVPVISDMYLEAGGICYPCVPFNGWYQADTEVGVRNFGDEGRYNMLPAVAAGMGLDTSRPGTLWRPRAVTELAVAALHSFRAAGVMSTDSQTEMGRFARFVAAEEEAGRPWCADWSWINPPIGASTTPAWHRTYPNPVLRPGFFRHGEPLPGS